MTPAEFKEIPERHRQAALQLLPFREREILKALSGTGDGRVYSLRELAPVFGVSFQRISQIAQRALDLVKLHLASVADAPKPQPCRAVRVQLVLSPSCDESFVAQRLAELGAALSEMHQAAGGAGFAPLHADAIAASGSEPRANRP